MDQTWIKHRSSCVLTFGTGENKEEKYLLLVSSTLFKKPTIVCSDLHTYGLRTFQLLTENFVDLSKFIVISVGDMAGDGKKGTDADPTELYTFLQNTSKQFLYVQGNHDLESPMTQTSNIADGETIDTDLGKIGGINGIISKRDKTEKTYISYLHKLFAQKIDILLTHETPKIPSCIGNQALFSTIQSRNKHPLIHIFGHCYHNEPFHFISGTQYINVDSRVIIIIPENYIEEFDDIFLYDMYLPAL